MNLYQLLKGKKPIISFLHVFGCKCYVLRNQGESLGKFESKADEAIFVGYSYGKSYINYNLRINIVMESITVVIDDIKIQELLDEGYHDALKFENDFEEGTDEFSDVETQGMEKRNFELTSKNSLQLDDPAIDSHIKPSVDVQNELSVKGNNQASVDRTIRAPSTANQFNIFKSMNLGGASQNHSSFYSK